MAVSLFRANAMEPTLEYSIYGVVIWLVVAPSFLQYFLWLAKTFPATRTPCSPRDVLVTLLMIALALPPVLMVCPLVSFQKASDFKGKIRNWRNNMSCNHLFLNPKMAKLEGFTAFQCLTLCWKSVKDHLHKGLEPDGWFHQLLPLMEEIPNNHLGWC